MSTYFAEGMTEDDEVFGKVAAEVMRSIQRSRNTQGMKKTLTSALLSAGGPLMQAAYFLDPKNKKDKKSLGWRQFTDITKQPDPDKYGTTLWRGSSWKQPLDPRFHTHPAEEPESGFPKVFGQLKTGGYGYRWPESRQEHDRYRGTIFGLPYGPPRVKSDVDRAEVNEAYQKRRRWLLQMIDFWSGRNQIKANNYRKELMNLGSNPEYN